MRKEGNGDLRARRSNSHQDDEGTVMKAAVLVSVVIGLFSLASSANAQKILDERQLAAKGNSAYVERDVQVSKDVVVTLKQVRLNDGSFKLRSIDQTEETFEKMDAFCSKWGARASRDAEVNVSKDAVALLPCVVESREKIGALRDILDSEDTRQARRSICGEPTVVAVLSGPGALEQGESGWFTAEGIYEWTAGPYQTTTLEGQVLPPCYVSANSGASRFNWIIYPFACGANVPRATYPGSVTASVCDLYDTAEIATIVY